MHKPFSRLHHVRIGLLFMGMSLAVMNIFLSDVACIWVSIFVFLIVLVEETIGKWTFYQAAHNPSFL
jgi:DMSO reductase anchor subunit